MRSNRFQLYSSGSSCKNSQNLLRLPSDFTHIRLHETFAKPNKDHEQGIKYLSRKENMMP